LGAALLLEVTGRVNNLGEGVAVAEDAIRDGRSEKLLKQLRAFSEALLWVWRQKAVFCAAWRQPAGSVVLTRGRG